MNLYDGLVCEQVSEQASNQVDYTSLYFNEIVVNFVAK